MLGFVDLMTAERVKGWAPHDPARNGPALVRAVLADAVIAECVADLPRVDVAKALRSDGMHGFDILLKGKVDPSELPKLKMLSSFGETWNPLKLTRKAGGMQAAPRGKGTYQDFDGTGGSKSRAKLDALRLDNLPREDASAPPLQGKSVLDIGCNEGFFCIEAVRQGARRVVGIDIREDFVDSARARCPEATFTRASWWDIPDEKFDCIFFLSAIHYEPEQQRLLRKLRDHLTPKGVLVLECGVVIDTGVRAWRTIKRADGIKKYPTMDLLTNDLLEGYAVRFAGKSVDQAGDTIPRYVFHCGRHAPVAMIIAAPPLAGKTNISNRLQQQGIPTYATDNTLTRLLLDKNQWWRPASQKLTKQFGKSWPVNLGKIGLFIVQNGLIDEVCDLFVAEVPIEAELFSIEGDILRHAAVRDVLEDKLIAKNIRPWLVAPMSRIRGEPTRRVKDFIWTDLLGVRRAEK